MSASSAPVPDLSVNKVLAGAGAAVTSAVIGSYFGVAGTVVGAAVGSTASTVTTAVYERSLNRTRATILARLHAGSGGSEDPGEHRADADDDRAARPAAHRRRWVGLVGGAVLVFLLGMLAVTGIEWVKGTTVTGEPGTSVGRVLAPRSLPGGGGAATSTTPSAEPSGSAEPSATSTPAASSTSADATQAPARSDDPTASTSSTPSRTSTRPTSAGSTSAGSTSSVPDPAAPATRPG